MQGRAVPTVRSSTHIVWSTGDPSPMQGAMSSWLNFIVGCAPVRSKVQPLSVADNREFHALLSAVGKTTGREMVLNTSFNVKGQQIVNTPREALDTFLGTGIEHLFLENQLVSRRAG